MLDQTIQLTPKAVSFTVVCGACAVEYGFLSAQVGGRLELERRHTTVTCGRGHEIRIERARRDPVGALSA